MHGGEVFDVEYVGALSETVLGDDILGECCECVNDVYLLWKSALAQHLDEFLACKRNVRRKAQTYTRVQSAGRTHRLIAIHLGLKLLTELFYERLYQWLQTSNRSFGEEAAKCTTATSVELMSYSSKGTVVSAKHVCGPSPLLDILCRGRIQLLSKGWIGDMELVGIDANYWPFVSVNACVFNKQW